MLPLRLLAEIGHLPAPPGLRIENRGAFTGRVREWLERYHTMIVLGFTLAFALGHKREFDQESADSHRLSRYGELLSATCNANVYESSVIAGELLASGLEGLPGARFQLTAVERMFRRHLALVEDESDPGLLADAMRLGDVTGTPIAPQGIEGINRLVRLVLSELGRVPAA